MPKSYLEDQVKKKKKEEEAENQFKPGRESTSGQTFNKKQAQRTAAYERTNQETAQTYVPKNAWEYRVYKAANSGESSGDREIDKAARELRQQMKQQKAEQQQVAQTEMRNYTNDFRQAQMLDRQERRAAQATPGERDSALGYTNARTATEADMWSALGNIAESYELQDQAARYKAAMEGALAQNEANAKNQMSLASNATKRMREEQMLQRQERRTEAASQAQEPETRSDKLLNQLNQIDPQTENWYSAYKRAINAGNDQQADRYWGAMAGTVNRSQEEKRKAAAYYDDKLKITPETKNAAGDEIKAAYGSESTVKNWENKYNEGLEAWKVGYLTGDQELMDRAQQYTDWAYNNYRQAYGEFLEVRDNDKSERYAYVNSMDQLQEGLRNAEARVKAAKAAYDHAVNLSTTYEQSGDYSPIAGNNDKYHEDEVAKLHEWTDAQAEVEVWKKAIETKKGDEYADLEDWVPDAAQTDQAVRDQIANGKEAFREYERSVGQKLANDVGDTTWVPDDTFLEGYAAKPEQTNIKGDPGLWIQYGYSFALQENEFGYGLTDEQKQTFYYIYAEDPEKAEDFAKACKKKNEEEYYSSLSKPEKNWLKRIVKQFTGSNAKLLSGLMPFTTEGQKLTKWGNAQIQSVGTGRQEYGLANTGLLTGTLPEDIPLVGGKGLSDWSQLESSMLMSGETAALAKVAMATGHPMAAAVIEIVGLGMQAGSAANDDYVRMRDLGWDDSAASIHSLFAGLAEATFEKVSLESFVDLDVSKGYLRSVLKQAGVEASEETFTTLANRLTDAATAKMHGYDAEEKRRAKEYMATGMSYDEAYSKARQDMFADLLDDAFGGFLSGGLMGGGSAVLQYTTGGIQSRSEGRRYGQNLDADAMQRAIQESIDKESKLRQNGDKAAARQEAAFRKGLEKAQLQGNKRGDYTTGESGIEARSIDDSVVGAVINDKTGKTDSFLEDYGKKNGLKIKETSDEAVSKRDQRNTRKNVETVVSDMTAKMSEGRSIESAVHTYEQIVSEYGEDAKPLAKQALRNTVETLAGSTTTKGNVSATTQYQSQIDAIQNEETRNVAQEGLDRAVIRKATTATQSQNKEQVKAFSDYATTREKGRPVTLKAEVTDADGNTKLVDITGWNDQGTKVVLQDGTQVDVNDLVADESTKSFLQAMREAGLGGMANVALKRFMTSEAANNQADSYLWMAAYKGAFNLGQQGGTQADLNNAIKQAARLGMDAETATEAFNLGQKLATDTSNTAKAKLPERLKASKKGVTGKRGSVQFESEALRSKVENSPELSEWVEDVRQAAEFFGVDVRITESKLVKNSKGELVYEGARGSHRAGVIEIDINSGTNFAGDVANGILQTMGHEMTHFMRYYNEDGYQNIKNFAFDQIRKQKGQAYLDDLIQKQLNDHKGDESFTYDDACEEVVAEFCQDMLLNKKTLETFAKESPKGFKAFVEWVKNFLAKIREKLAASPAADNVRAIYQAMEENLKDVFGEMWAKEQMTAIRTHDTVNKGTRTDSGNGKPKFQLRGVTADGIRVYETDVDQNLTFDEKQKLYRKRIGTVINLGGVKLRTDVKKIDVKADYFTRTKNSHGDEGSGLDLEAKFNALYDTADMLATSKYVKDKTKKEPSYEDPNIKPKNKAHEDVKYWYKFKNRVILDGYVYDVIFNIRDKGKEQYQYVIEFHSLGPATEKQMSQIKDTAGYSDLASLSGTSDESKVSQSKKKVNSKNKKNQLRDTEYLDAVENKEDWKAEKMVRDAAKQWGAATDENGRPIPLYHGTPSFGFTVFKDGKHNVPFIYTSTNPTVSAHYAGDKNYAGRRPIGRKYRTGTNTADIIENAKWVYESNYHVMSQEEKLKAYREVEKQANEVADKIDELHIGSWNAESDAFKNMSDEVANAIAWVEDMFWTIRDSDYKFSFDNEGSWDGERSEFFKVLDSDIENAKTQRAIVQEWYDENRKNLSAKEKAFLSYLLSYDVTDAAIDIEYKLRRVATDNDVIMNEAGNINNPLDLKESMDLYHEIGAYTLYGNLGDNPFIFDAKGAQFWGVKVPEIGDGYYSTDTISKWAYDNGYTGVVMKNIYDYGDKADNYVFFNSSQLKSADPVTYDDNGDVIPLSERFSENEDIRYQQRDYNPTVVLEEKTIDKYLADYASKSSPNYAQAYIVQMHPNDFLKLTTSTIGRNLIASQTKGLNVEELKDATRHQPFQLRIDTDTGQVEGHEGRHRAMALYTEGIRSIPVLLFDSSNKYSKTAMDSLDLKGQDFGSSRSNATVTVKDLQPLSYANRDNVVQKFTTQPSLERISEKYGDTETIRYQQRDYDTPSDIDLVMGMDEADADTREGKALIREAKAKEKQIQELKAKLAEAQRQMKTTQRALNTRGIGNVAKGVIRDFGISDAKNNRIQQRATEILTNAYQKALDQIDSGATAAEAWDTVYNGAVEAAELLLTEGRYTENNGGKWTNTSFERYIGADRHQVIDAMVGAAAQDFVTNRYRDAIQETAADRLVARTEKRMQGKIDETKAKNAALKEQNEKLTRSNEDLKNQTEMLKATGQFNRERIDDLIEAIDQKNQELRKERGRTAETRKQRQAWRQKAAAWKQQAQRGTQQIVAAVEQNMRLQAKLEKQIQREQRILEGKLKPPAMQRMLKDARENAAKEMREKKDTQIQRMRENRKASELRNRIKNLHAEMQRALLNPREGHYVPQDLTKPVIDLLEMVSSYKLPQDIENLQKRIDAETDPVKRQKLEDRMIDLKARQEKADAKINEISTAYARMKGKEDVGIYYDETVQDMLNELSGTIKGKTIYDLNVDELSDVFTVMKAMNTTIRNAVKADLVEKGKNIFEVGNELISELRNSKGAHRLNALESWHKSQLSPLRAFKRFGGYMPNSTWLKMYDMLNAAQNDMMWLEMQGTRIFDGVLGTKADRRLAEKLSSTDEKDLVDIGLKDSRGNPVKITRGMMLSLYMHLQNEDNLRHMMYGGLTLPGMKQYYGQKSGDAWGSAKTRIPALGARVANLDQLFNELGEEGVDQAYQEQEKKIKEMFESIRQKIEDELTIYDRRWIASAKEFFDNFSRRELNKATMSMYGFNKARVDNYFPITSDPAYLKTDIDSIKRDVSLENAGFMKSRVKSGNPILLEDISKVVNRQISKVAQYAGMTEALKTFDNVYKVQQKGYADSVKDALRDKFEAPGQKYVENLLSDLVGGRSQDSTIFDKIKSNYAQAVLAANLSVTIKQAASFPTAAAVVGWKPLMKALAAGGKSNLPISRANRELIDIYTPLLWKRAQGAIDVELGDVAKGRDWTQKASWLMGWIQKTDVATVGRLWSAAEYYVKENYKGLEKGTAEQIKNGESEYYKKVAEIFNRIVEETQPNYSVMQRPDILRNPNKLLRAVTMFSTQRLQNANILIDSVSEYNAMRAWDKKVHTEESKAARAEAWRNLRHAISSQAVSTLVLNLMTYFAGVALHRMNPWRDDDDELTWESRLKEFLDGSLSTLFGSFLWGSDAYDAIHALFTDEKYYKGDVGGISTIYDFIESTVKTGKAIKKLAEKDNVTWDDVKNLAHGQLYKTAEYISQLAGVPVGNVKKILDGAYYHGVDMINGEFHKFESDVERTNATNAHRFLEALLSNDQAKADKVLAEMRKNILKEHPNRSEDKINGAIQSAIQSKIKEMLLAGEIREQQAEKWMVEYGSSEDADDAYWDIQKWYARDKWEGDPDQFEWSKYDTMFETMDEGYDIRSDVDELIIHGVEESEVYENVKKHIREQYDTGKISADEAMELLQKYHKVKEKNYYRKDNADEAWMTVQEWDATAEHKGEKDYSWSKYEDLREALKNGGDVEGEIRTLSEHGVEDEQLYKDVKATIGDLYAKGEISETEAMDMLQDYHKTKDSKTKQYRNDTADEAYWAVQEWNANADHEDDEEYSYSKYENLRGALSSGKGVDTAISELLGHGFKEESVNDQINKTVKELYTNGDITEAKAIELLTKYHKVTEDKKLRPQTADEAWASLREASAKAEHADEEDYSYSKYDDIDAAIDKNGDIKALVKEMTDHGAKEEDVKSHVKSYLVDKFVQGQTTEAALKNQLSRYCGIVSKDDVDKILRDANCKKQFGVNYSGLDEEYRAGNVSRSDMKTALTKYGGLSSADADKKIRWYDLQKSNPNLSITESQSNNWHDGTSKSRENGHESAKAAGMSIEAYLKAKEILDEIKDSNGNNTGEDEYIAALSRMTNLTARQKDALYYEKYKGTTKYSKKTW